MSARARTNPGEPRRAHERRQRDRATGERAMGEGLRGKGWSSKAERERERARPIASLFQRPPPYPCALSLSLSLHSLPRDLLEIYPRSSSIPIRTCPRALLLPSPASVPRSCPPSVRYRGVEDRDGGGARARGGRGGADICGAGFGGIVGIPMRMDVVEVPAPGSCPQSPHMPCYGAGPARALLWN